MRPIFKRNRKKMFFIPFGIAALLAMVSYLVMVLWNHLLPEILHVNTITFWQALGIFILCKILFGFGKGGGTPWSGHRMADRFKDMSSEERQQFKEDMRNKMCRWKKYDSENSSL